MKSLLFAILLLALSGCTYYGTYEFIIYNTLEDTLYIDFSKKFWYPLENMDSSIYILPNREKLFYSTMSEEIHKGEAPHGYDQPNIPDFVYIHFTVSGMQSTKDFKNLDYWNFSHSGQTGQYILYVNDTIL